MRTKISLLLLLVAKIVLAVPAVATTQEPQKQSLPSPTVTSAADGIFAAFRTHSLVGIGDYHGLAQEEDFYAALIRDKRFAETVGNVVVEFGDAAQQETLDRYLAGDDVAYEQLRKIWSDTVGWIPMASSLGYANFFAQVREVNLGLPPAHRIHVWLGDPPFDWSKFKTREDLLPDLGAERDQYPAEIIKTQILAKNKKALVIYGTLHFFDFDGAKSLQQLIEGLQPSALFIVTPYTGFNERSCSDAFEQFTRKWSIPALATPVRGSSLEARLRVRGCHFVPARFVGSGASEAERAKLLAQMEEFDSGIAGDALLYLGPAASLTRAQEMPDLSLDLKFRAEIDRRMFLMTGSHLSPLTKITVSPQYLRPYGGIQSEASR